MSELTEIARQLLSYLPGLAGTEADRWSREIVALLDEHAAGEQVDERLIALFSTSREVRTWVAMTAENKKLLPPEIARRPERYEPLAGDPIGTPLQTYECPRGNCQVWHRLSPSEIVPRCEVHHEVLVPTS